MLLSYTRYTQISGVCRGESSVRCIQCGPAAVFGNTCDVGLHCVHFSLDEGFPHHQLFSCLMKETCLDKVILLECCTGYFDSVL